MASDLLSIGASGARAARGALDVAAQNIANAATEGYVRRTAQLSEVASSGGTGTIADISLSGVRLTGISRVVDQFRSAEVRRTTSNAERVSTETRDLQNLESALEQSGLFASVVNFEGNLEQLAGYPTDSSLRSAALAGADRLANSFNIAAQGLQAAGDNARFEASAGTDEVNMLAGELARINSNIPRAEKGSAEAAYLLDQRDLLLSQLSERADISVQFNDLGLASVTLGGAGGAALVEGTTTRQLTMNTAGDGTITFAIGGTDVNLSGGSLQGHKLALDQAAAYTARLDTLADDMATRLNAVQAGGVALDGTAGQPLFTGSGAAGIRVALTSGSALATAPAGAGADSRDNSNVIAMQAAFGTGGAQVAKGVDSALFDLSSTVAARKITGEALETIAGSARYALEQYTGVDLDKEATDLVRFQQAFQASGRVMQVAADLFDTLLGIR